MSITKELKLNLKKPSGLFQLLNSVTLASARIRAGNALQGSKALIDSGLTTPAKMLDTSWKHRVKILNRNGYARYDESRARFLEHNARMVNEKYQGDLRKLVENKPAKIKKLVQEFKGIGPTGSKIFLRELKEINMPAKSKSQQQLFGMIHAYQTGKLKRKPSPEVKEMSKELSPSQTGEFAKTKHKGLPGHVKKAYAPVIPPVIKPVRPKETAWNKEHEKYMMPKAGNWSEKLKALRIRRDPDMNEESSFKIGFIKAAIDAGMDGLTAVGMLKYAEMPNMDQLGGQLHGLINNLGPAGYGALGGGAMGALMPSEDPNHSHKIRNTLLGALAGGGLGYGVENLNKFGPMNTETSTRTAETGGTVPNIYEH